MSDDCQKAFCKDILPYYGEGDCICLPKIGQIVRAKCLNAKGEEEYHLIRRIKTKDTDKGWQWSGLTINTYFTFKVLSWEPYESKEEQK